MSATPSDAPAETAQTPPEFPAEEAPQTPGTLGLSVVVPFFEEADGCATLVAELRAVLTQDGLPPFELILVDDGSQDATFKNLQQAAAGEPRCLLVRLARNYGQTAALAAGIERATGDVIVLLDGDGQNDPKDIPLLLEILARGEADVVSGWRKNRQDSLISRKIPSRIANKLVARWTGVHLHDFGCSLKAYRREFLEGIRLYGEMHRFLVIHSAWEGARLAEVVVNHRARTQGQSKYGLERIFKVMLDLMQMIFMRKFATKPIYLFGGFGLVSFTSGLFSAGVSLALKVSPYALPHPLAQRDLIQTPLPLLAVMLGLVGLLSILLGLVAEMLTRTYHESQQKPVYRVGEIARGAEAPA